MVIEVISVLSLLSWSMYFLSFFPLWIAVLFVDARSIGTNNNTTEILTIILIVIGIVISLYVLHSCLKRTRMEEQQVCIIEKAVEQKSITADFILAYILPLLAFDFTQWDQVVLFLIFFLTLGMICIRHNYLILNIVLDLMGYRFYECSYINTDKREISKTVISQQRLNAKIGLEMKVYPINDDYVIDQFSRR